MLQGGEAARTLGVLASGRTAMGSLKQTQDVAIDLVSLALEPQVSIPTWVYWCRMERGP